MTEQQLNPDDLLTIEEVQDKLHCSRRLVYGLVNDGELVMVKLRRRVRITRASLTALIERNKKPPATKAS